MRIALLQHVRFEGPGAISDWARSRRHALDVGRIDRREPMPSIAEFDALVVMGGPMGVHDEDRYSWLEQEKRLIADSIAAGRAVLGICLGAQLVATAYGARVTRNTHKEIGWHAIKWSDEARALSLFNGVPAESVVFHWHADTFTLPSGTIRVASSEACLNQGFSSPDGRVVGLQFHAEMRSEDVRRLVAGASADLAAGGPYVQSEQALLQRCEERCATLDALLFAMLDRWSDVANGVAGA